VSVIRTTECVSDCGNDPLSADHGDERIEPMSCAPTNAKPTTGSTPAASLTGALAAFIVRASYGAAIMSTPAPGQSR
jgi:hypothetical protein